MKKVVLLIVLSLSLTSCSLLDRGLKNIHEIAETCEPNVTCIKSFSPNFEFNVLECRGHKIEKKVDIILTIKHSLPNQKMKFYKASRDVVAYGEMGNSYKFKNFEFPNSEWSWINQRAFVLPTNVLLKGKLTFENISPKAKKLVFVGGTIGFENKDGGGDKGEGRFEIRNLKIDWK